MFFFLSKTLDLAVSPLTWILVLVAWGAVLHHRGARRRSASTCLAGAAAVVVVLGNPMVANRLWWSLEADQLPAMPSAETYDAVVLLGGVVPRGWADPGEPPSYGDNVERLLAAYDLLRLERARHVIVSGGAPGVTPPRRPEAVVLADQLAAWGIEPERIVVEPASLNTRENARESARIARERGWSRIVVVTSAFHMERALGCFRGVDLAVDPWPVDHRAERPADQAWQLAPRAGSLQRSSDALRELAGRVVYRLVGYAG